MSAIESYFATPIYQVRPQSAAAERLRADVERACLGIAADDKAGQAWCASHDYRGYTSYASLDDLSWRDPAMAELVRVVDSHVAEFARWLDYDLSKRRLTIDSLWINVLEPGGMHAGHIHPGSVVSGTYYVALPPGAAGIKFEDPRLAMTMGEPPRRQSAGRRNRSFVEIAPKPGTILLWQSFVRHEVPPSRAKSERISVSFNYNWPAATME